jgi:hypothetical protein
MPGVQGEMASSEIAVLNTDTMKWIVPQVRTFQTCQTVQKFPSDLAQVLLVYHHCA